jgi:ABC-type sugar transport system ATPase subunit
MAPLSPGATVVEAVGISKHFGHVTALDNVTLGLGAGEVTAVVGDNGAGKSTLCSMFAGLLQPDEGEVRIRNQVVHLSSPSRAQTLGIATVFQDLALVPQRDVAANVFAGQERYRWGFLLDRRRMLQETSDLIADMKVNLPSARTRVGDLSGGQRQATAIVRALLGNHVATLMDEPTAALGLRESRRVMELMNRLRDAGQAVMLITHNMDSVFEWCDRVVVMRLGRIRADHRSRRHFT